MNIEKILFDEKSIAAKVSELAAAISRDYAGKELILVCILKGGLTFTADLMRAIAVSLTVEFVSASSYGNAAKSCGSVDLDADIGTDLKGKHVLLVDTIVDTGRTLDHIFRALSIRDPASLEAVALLDKKSRRTAIVPLQYIGFEIPDLFVVGYGMDYGQQYRNLPYIGVVKAEG
jgi:hypoxanthine phosphoribosyltransferase